MTAPPWMPPPASLAASSSSGTSRDTPSSTPQVPLPPLLVFAAVSLILPSRRPLLPVRVEHLKSQSSIRGTSFHPLTNPYPLRTSPLCSSLRSSASVLCFPPLRPNPEDERLRLGSLRSVLHKGAPALRLAEYSIPAPCVGTLPVAPFPCLAQSLLPRSPHQQCDPSQRRKHWTRCSLPPIDPSSSQAARVHPEGGQPHNQLAVLATYAEDELGAVYHYTRALSTASPFLTARENLVMLFDKSRQRAALLEAGASPQEPQRGRGGRGRGGRAGRGRKGPEFADGPTPGSVVSRYIRLAGILFTKTSLETLPALGEAAAEELRALLLQGGGQGKKRAEDQQQQQRRLGKRLLQLAAVLIFCVDNTQYIPKGHIPGYSEMVQRGVLQRGALALLYGFLARLASPSASSAALLPLALGVQWLQANPSFAAPEDPDQAEASARAEFLRAAADLLPSLRALEPFAPEPLGSAPLPEDKDMRGFRPLAPIHELLDWSNR